MARVVVVFEFPDPEDSYLVQTTLETILESAKNALGDTLDVKAHVAIKEVAEEIMQCFNQKER